MFTKLLLIFGLFLLVTNDLSAQPFLTPGDPPGLVGEGFFSGETYGVYQCEGAFCSYAQTRPDGELTFGSLSGNSAGAYRFDCSLSRPCSLTWQPALLPPVTFGEDLGQPGYGPRSRSFSDWSAR